MIPFAIRDYWGKISYFNLCGWRSLKTNVVYVFLRMPGFKNKLWVIKKEIWFILDRIRGNAICPGKEFTESLSEEYRKKALVLSPSPEESMLRSVETMRQQGYAVTLVTDKRHAAEMEQALQDKGVRVIPARVSGGNFKQGTVKKLLSNGYERALCCNDACFALATSCGKVCIDKGLTDFELV